MTLEALSSSLAIMLIKEMGYAKAVVTVEKPNAYGFADGPGVTIVRFREPGRLG